MMALGIERINVFACIERGIQAFFQLDIEYLKPKPGNSVERCIVGCEGKGIGSVDKRMGRRTECAAVGGDGWQGRHGGDLGI